MENKMEDSRIIDYLYGEMSKDEKTNFEKELGRNPTLKAEVQALLETHDLMGKLEDKEVVAPSFVFNEDSNYVVPFVKSTPFRWVSSIAAGLAILLVAGYILNFNLTKSESGMQIGFGEKAVAQNQINKEDVQSWMKEVMTDYDNNANAKLANLESKLSTKMDSQDKKNYESFQTLVGNYSNESDKMMRAYVSQVSDENKQMIENFFVVSNDTQKKYMQNVLADFNEFYQNQRSYDLKVIETSIGLMKNNYDVQQIEQDNLLANLYDMVQTQSK